MARRPRLFASGLLYHVIVRGNQRQKTFRSGEDYQAYLERMESYRNKHRVRIFAYCLMPNHVHLLLETGSAPLSKFMQGLQQSYTQYFNRRYRKVGHLFQGRYKAIICDKDKYLLALVRYIHLNPVRVGLVQRPERYSYSGHASYLKTGTPKIIEVLPILSLLGGRKGYERFVLDGIAGSHNEEYYTVKDQRFLGEEGFGEELSRGVEEEPERRRKKPIETMIKEVAKCLGTTPEVLQGPDRHWAVTRKRAEAIVLLVRDYGYKVTEVARSLRRDQANVSLMLSRSAARAESEGRRV